MEVKDARAKGAAKAEENWSAFRAELGELGKAPAPDVTAKLYDGINLFFITPKLTN